MVVDDEDFLEDNNNVSRDLAIALGTLLCVTLLTYDAVFTDAGAHFMQYRYTQLTTGYMRCHNTDARAYTRDMSLITIEYQTGDF